MNEIAFDSQQTLKLLEKTNKAAKIGVFQLEVATNKIYWNEVLRSIYEVAHNFEPSFENVVDLVEDDIYKEQLRKAHFDVIEHGKSYELEYPIVTAKGNKRFIWVKGEAVFEDGKCLYSQGTVMDITKRKNSEIELEKKYQQLRIAESIAMIGYWQWNYLTNTITWSDNLYTIYGHNKKDPISFEVYLNYIHEEDKEFVNANLRKTLKDKIFRASTYKIALKNGVVKTIKSIGKVITNKDGDIIEMTGVCQDITESQIKEQELRDKNQFLSFAEEIAEIGNWKWDAKTEEYTWSDNLYRILGIEIGTPISLEEYLKRVPVEEHVRLYKNAQLAVSSKKFPKLTHTMFNKAGELRTFDVFGKVLTDENGNVTTIIGASQDITEQKIAENKILKTNQHLQETSVELISRNKQLADFNHITSHNLRAPVSNLNALLDLWKGAEEENEKEELFGKFEIVIDHLTATLNSLIESLRVSNKKDITKNNLSFNETLSKTKEILAAQILKTGAIIKSDFSKQESISYNQIYLESIFLNLVSNAIKYKSPHRIPEIEIKTNMVNGKTNLSITDNGLGIDLKHHGHKLFGLNKVFHRHPEAKGIGLFLTKAQIESMGGSIFAESKVNVGTTFFINFN